MVKKFDVCMIGLGPVGTTSGLCFAKQGFKVVGVDIDEKRVKTFADNKAPFVEPGINELVVEAQKAGNFEATTNLKEAVKNSRIVMIAVGTPTPPESGKPDLSFLDSACKAIGEALKEVQKTDGDKGTIVVVRSTVPPGTMRNRLAKVIEQASGLTLGRDFFVGANPEFLREGKAISDFFKTGRIVAGSDQEWVIDDILALYRDVEGKRMKVGLETAEFAKYVDNTWHALKVSFANEIGRVCAGFGGNVNETTEVFLADNNLNISSYYLRPGFAFGGSCLPKDTRGIMHLASLNDVEIPVISSILDSNKEHIERGIKRITANNPKRVGILGVAFKENVDDLRESPSLTVAAGLMAQNIQVVAHDHAFKAGDEVKLPGTVSMLSIVDLEEIAKSCDTIALLHRLPDYANLNAQAAKRGIPVIDLTTITDEAA